MSHRVKAPLSRRLVPDEDHLGASQTCNTEPDEISSTAMQAAPQSPNLIAEGTLLDGKFHILRCVGRGGMGAVYEIEHAITKHRRALKMLYPNVARDRDAVDRFLLEASAAGTIQNPHIVETYDAGWLSTGEPYLVMELLEGEALDARLAHGTSLPVADALQIVAQAARGAHAAHEAGIVHRDLKPENLFVSVDDDLAVFTKIVDFGVSKFDGGLARSRATQAGAFMGTPQYMSPEQFLDGKRVDRRADVYSLGVILFECLTGKHPYPCDTLAQLARKIMVEEIPPPSSLRADLPPGLDAVLARALKKEPDERYQTAAAFAHDLEQARSGDQVTLPHGSRWPSDLPPKMTAPRVPTIEVCPPPPPEIEPEAAPTKHAVTTMRSPRPSPTTQSGTMLLPGREGRATLARRGRAALVVAGLGVAATGVFVWSATSRDESRPIGGPPETPAPNAAPPAPTQPLAPTVSAATSVTPPRAASASASITVVSSAAPTSAHTPRAASTPALPKPRDFADVDEFPD